MEIKRRWKYTTEAQKLRYPRLEDQNLDDLTLELLYPTDEAAEHCIKEFLALRLDDDNEHELEQ